MHVRTKKPDCYTRECGERGTVWLNRGRDCGNFRDADGERRNLANTPGCEGCARMVLARFRDGRWID